MPVTQFDHYTLRSRDLDATARFYAEVMGFRIERLDIFEFPMRLLFLGDHAIVHLLGAGPALDAFLSRSAPALENSRARATSNLEHMAFNATGLAEMLQRLQSSNTPFTQRTLADYGVVQLIFEDPDGVEIEVNFQLSEKTA